MGTANLSRSLNVDVEEQDAVAKMSKRRIGIAVVVVLVALVAIIAKSASSDPEFTIEPLTDQGAPAGVEQLAGSPDIDLPREFNRFAGSVNDTKWRHYVSDDSPEEVFASFGAELALEGFDDGRVLDSGGMLFITAFERVGIYAVEVDGRTTVVTFRGHE